MITQFTLTFFLEKWGDNPIESQNVKANQRYRIIIKVLNPKMYCKQCYFKLLWQANFL